jgi:nucleolar complex protein 3
MGQDISTDLDCSDSAPDDSNSDEEKEYETRPRKIRKDHDERDKHLVARLPIKLPDGSLKPMGQRRLERTSETPPPTPLLPRRTQPEPVVDDVATGTRFGRLAVVDVIRIEPREARVHAAKEQLASICQDIVADPENAVSNR